MSVSTKGIGKGDTVRVTIEGVVVDVGESFVETEDYYFEPSDSEIVDIEVIEKQPSFTPGDVLRDKASGNLFALADQGFVNLKYGNYYQYGQTGITLEDDGKMLTLDKFTPDRFEKVVL